VAASVDALVALLVAALIMAFAGPWGSLAFVVPAALLVRAGIAGRRSERATRQQFSDLRQWRDAEREAVAAVFFSALLRKRWPFAR
jgi:hypothetical protein